MRRRDERTEEDARLEELAAIYQAVDAAFAGWSCSSSTECCHFGITGREPYVTTIELAAIRRAIAARGGPVAIRAATERSRRKLPMIPPDPDHATGRCALLDAVGRCAVYAARPLGCRTFFCDRATAGTPVRQRDINGFVRLIEELSARQTPSDDRGRPLTRALGELAGFKRR